jgi:hypothetical protein
VSLAKIIAISKYALLSRRETETEIKKMKATLIYVTAIEDGGEAQEE